MNGSRLLLAAIGLVAGWMTGGFQDAARPAAQPATPSAPRDTADALGATRWPEPANVEARAAAADDAEAAANDEADAVEPSDSGEIAFVDLNYVLQNDPPFKDALVRLKSEIAEAEAALESRKREIDGMAEQLKILVAGTPQHDRLTREIVTAQAELAGRLQAEKAAFQRREAILYLDAYQRVVRQTEDLARRRGLKAVMRLISPEVNASNPQSILEHINRPLVWHDPRRDITRDVLDELVASAKPAATIDEVPEAPESPRSPDDPGASGAR